MNMINAMSLATAIDNINCIFTSEDCNIPKEDRSKVQEDFMRLSTGIKNGTIKVSKKTIKAINCAFGIDILYIEEICHHFGITRATHARWVECGKLPKLHKDSGGKKYNYLHECEETLTKWNELHKN